MATGLCFASLFFFMEQFLHFLRGRLFTNLGMARSLRQNGSISFFYTCSASSVGGTLLITQQVIPITTATLYIQSTLHPEGDREVLLPVHPNVGATFLFQMFTLNLLTQPGRTFGKGGFISAVWLTILSSLGKSGSSEVPANEWLKAVHSDQVEQKLASIRWSRILITFHVLVLAVTVWTELWVLPLIITIPSYTANWLSYFLGLTQHCGLRQNTTDFRKNTRSIRLPKFVEYLYWHMNWHTEHHMYAGVPCYNLPDLAQEIKNDPKYAFDTPVPENLKSTAKLPSEAKSIGDLAPKGLV